MTECVLPSSPSWFLSSVSSGSDAGLYAFGAKHHVYVFDVSHIKCGETAHSEFGRANQSGSSLNNASRTPKLISTYTEHEQKVTSVCLSPDPEQLICCSADETSVKLWDISSRTTIQVHNEHREKITCMTWSPCNLDLVITASEKGTMVLWKLKSNTVKSFQLQKDNICCIKASPHTAALVAIGYRSSGVLIVKLDHGHPQILQRLRGFETEVTSVCWCPVEGETGLDISAGHRGPLVAAAGGRLIKIWDSSTGKDVFFKKLQSAATPRANSQDPASKKQWLEIQWLKSSPNYLVSSSPGPHGELFLWSLNTKTQQEPDLFDSSNINKHLRVIFNITPVGDKICTFSLDRVIAVWDMKTRKGLVSICSFGGFPYCIRASLLDPGMVAIGAGDNTIRVWNQNSKSRTCDVTSLCYGPRTMITSVAWHPEREGLLAFGTDDGRVGVANTLIVKPPWMSSTFHKRTVYVVCWGPPLHSGTGRGHQVYSLGCGTVLQHFIGESGNKKEAVNLIDAIHGANGTEADELIRSEIVWKRDYTGFAIGCDNGSVGVYSFPELIQLFAINVHHKMINCIRWHPEVTTESLHGSPCRNLVAFGGNDRHISVVDLPGWLDDGSIDAKASSVTPTIITGVFCQLSAHLTKTTDICWSPHHDGRLVSVGYDRIAIVWNVKNGQCLASYSGHSDRLLTVLWSCLDPDLIMTGGCDAMLHVWRVSAQSKFAIDINDRKKKKKKPTTSASVHATEEPMSDPRETTASEQEIQELQDLLVAKQQQLMSQLDEKETVSKTVTDVSVHQSADIAVADISEKSKKRKVKQKSFFPVSSQANNRGKAAQQEDLLDLSRIITGQGSADLIDKKPHLGLFSDRLGAHRCLLQESEHHLSHDSMEHHLQLELWRGNVAGAIQIARQRNELSDWIVSMAPLASHDLWELVSAEYAEQLEDEGQYHKAVSYLLAAHKVHQAVELFRRHKLFREAVSLAKVRLSSIDPVLEDLYTDWGQHLMKEGHYEQAAKCYLAMRQIQEAAKSVTRRHDQSSLRTACHMTLIANEKQQGLAFAYKLFSQYLMMGEWQEAHKFLAEHHLLKVLMPVLYVHEALVSHLAPLCPNLSFTQKPLSPEMFHNWEQKETQTKRTELPEFLLDRSDCDPVVPWEPLLIGEHTFPHQILRGWYCHLDVTMSTQELKSMYTAISKQVSQRHNTVDTPSLLVTVSVDITLCLLALLTSETSTAIAHLLQAMSSLHTGTHVPLQRGLCRLMLPQGPKYLLKLQREFNASRVLITMECQGDMDDAGETYNSARKFMTDIKDDGAISMSGVRCRELDCLRAYCYLTILDCLREKAALPQTENNSLDGMPSRCSLVDEKSLGNLQTRIAVGDEKLLDNLQTRIIVGDENSSGNLQTRIIVGDEKSSGNLQTHIIVGDENSSGNLQTRIAVGDENSSGNLQTRIAVGDENSLGNLQTRINVGDELGSRVGDKPVKGSGKENQICLSGNVTASKRDGLKTVHDECVCDLGRSGKPSLTDGSLGVGRHLLNNNGDGQILLDNVCDVQPLLANGRDVQPLLANGRDGQPLLDNCGDGQPLLDNCGDGQAVSNSSPRDCNQQLTLNSGKSVKPSSAASESLLEQSSTSQDSFYPDRIIPSNNDTSSLKRIPNGESSKDCNSAISLPHNSLSLPLKNAVDSSGKTPDFVENFHQTSSAELLESPSHETAACDDLHYLNLRRLSKGILWDVQAKREALTETLGYVHQAISQHLLFNRSASDNHQCDSEVEVLCPPASSRSVQHIVSGDPEDDGSCQRTRVLSAVPSPQLEASSLSAKPEADRASQTSRNHTSPNDRDTSRNHTSPSDRDTSRNHTSSNDRDTSRNHTPSNDCDTSFTAQTHTSSTPERARSSSPPPTVHAAAPSHQASPSENHSTHKNHARFPSKLEHSLAPHTEQEDLGSTASEPMVAHKPRKVLWQDGKDSDDLDSSGGGSTFQISRLAPDGCPIPLEWDGLPVDVKYSMPYVSLALLRQEQESISQELKRVSDCSKVPFPATSVCVKKLVQSSLTSAHLSGPEKSSYLKQLSDWAAVFAVTSHQQTEMEALFAAVIAK